MESKVFLRLILGEVVTAKGVIAMGKKVGDGPESRPPNLTCFEPDAWVLAMKKLPAIRTTLRA